MHKLWRKQLKSVFQDFQEYYPKMQTFQDPEDLHQMRISLRKMLTLFLFLKTHNQAKSDVLDNFYMKAKALASSSGALRDYDVMIEYLEETKFKVGKKRLNVKPIISLLKKEQIIEQQRILLTMPKFYDKEFQRLWDEIIDKKNLKDFVKNVQIEEDFEKLIKKFNKRHIVYLQNKEELGATNDETVASLHKLRLQSKKLRYSYTYLGFAFEKNTRKEVKKYKKMQEYFGEINDLYNLHECLMRLEQDYPYIKRKSNTLTRHIGILLDDAMENVKISKPKYIPKRKPKNKAKLEENTLQIAENKINPAVLEVVENLIKVEEVLQEQPSEIQDTVTKQEPLETENSELDLTAELSKETKEEIIPAEPINGEMLNSAGTH